MASGLTSRQSQLLAFIRKFNVENGFSPSFDQMADGAGLSSKSGVSRLLTALQERGHIRRISNRARSIEVIDTADLARFSSMGLRRELMRRSGAEVRA